MKSTLALILAMSLAGCSTGSYDIKPAHASSAPYRNHTCAQLDTERELVREALTTVGDRLDQAAANDGKIAALGIIVLWPALFFLGGTGPEESEYARLQGERDAIERTSIDRGCSIPYRDFMGADPITPSKEYQ